ncbi:MAG: histidinol-phosphatase [Caulobacterales bacterium]|jgi:myo-inositol-1(or 4)-monophosphatase
MVTPQHPFLSPADSAELLAFAGELADAARAAILPHFRAGPIDIENKASGAFDPVTEADRGAERAMRALIESRYPDHGIEGEEFGLKPSASGWSWVLDPVDGTRAFISGLPLWGTLIGLTYETRPIIGIIDQAYLQERFRGWPGGADLHDRHGVRPLRVRACPDLREATASTTDVHLFNPSEAGGFEMVRRTARLTRYGCDCYAYAMLASGYVDLVVESGLKPYDVAGLIPVIEGAGGSVTNWRGEPAWRGGQIIAAGDPRARDQALVALRRAAD